MHLALVVGLRRPVGEDDGQGLLEADRGGTLGLKHGGELLLVPLGIVEQQLRQFDRLVHPHAARTQGPVRPRKELAIGGIVEIDRVLIGKHEFDLAQGVLGSRRLAKGVGQVVG